MWLSASDIYAYLKPWPCDLRVFLLSRNVEQDQPSPYTDVVRQLGLRHEAQHLEQLGPHLDLSTEQAVVREQRTTEAVRAGVDVIYHPRLIADTELNGVQCTVVGEPDYLIRDGTRYVIRDSKVSRHIEEGEHAEILRQMELYGWLYERSFGATPERLEVHAGSGEIVPLAYDGGIRALALLSDIVGWQLADTEPYHPVSWSGCGPCPYHTRCWTSAEQRHDPSLVPDVDRGLALALRELGVATWSDLAARFDVRALEQLQRPWGRGTQRVGKRAAKILRGAQALATQREIWIEKPTLPAGTSWVMFDLEGLPPQLSDDQKVFVWGMQVFGESPSPYRASTPASGGDGDRAGWEGFLRLARDIFGEHGDIAFVHWHSYERERLDKYVARFGDPEGVAIRVRRNLFDMLPVVRQSVALPVPSYSLKVVERHVGYQRTQDDYGGEWAMAKYIEASETDDPAVAAELIEEVLTYNREDLEATWAVFRWLKSAAIGRAGPQ